MLLCHGVVLIQEMSFKGEVFGILWFNELVFHRDT